MRNDRRSVLWQWGLPEPDALVLEARFGIDTIDSGETMKGAARFASGAGRHGTAVDEPLEGAGS
jgi:enoyl-CoA hydratase